MLRKYGNMCSCKGPLLLLFTAKDMCSLSRYPCDRQTATCHPATGSFTCTCQDGYVKTQLSDRVCHGETS